MCRYQEVIYPPKVKIDLWARDCTNFADPESFRWDRIRLTNLLSPKLFVGFTIRVQLVVGGACFERINFQTQG